MQLGHLVRASKEVAVDSVDDSELDGVGDGDGDGVGDGEGDGVDDSAPKTKFPFTQ